MLRVTRPGLLSTLQDAGRTGLRHLGIPWAGTVCPAWQSIANALIGNGSDETVIECYEGGLQLYADACDVRIAIVGSVSSTIQRSSQGVTTSLGINRSMTLAAGDTLTVVTTGEARLIVVAVAGMQIPLHLGSTSTYAKASLGGLSGLQLVAGEEIPLRSDVSLRRSTQPDWQCTLPDELTYVACQLRVIAGPQFDGFSEAGKKTFATAKFALSAEADRMGARLTGVAIEHLDSTRHNIVSDAIVPGSVQVPGNGQPIVMLNDAHTAGGYPKIATVISCDLPLLAIQRHGSPFHFSLIDIDEAIAARRKLRDLIQSAIQSFSPCLRTELDSVTLLQTNLIDGVTDGS